MPENPPPYFPQSQLSPPDPNRYRKFKIIVGVVSFALIVGLGLLAYAIYYALKTT